MGGELFELGQDACERRLNIGDGAFRIIGALLLQAPVVLDEFFSVKLDDRVRRVDRP